MAGSTWDLGGAVPDNTELAQYCVLINGHEVTLDDDVHINDLVIVSPVLPAHGRLQIGPTFSGHLTVENGGGILANGAIEVARESRIDAVGGTGVTIGEYGKYIPDRLIPAANSAVLNTNEVTLTWTWPALTCGT